MENKVYCKHCHNELEPSSKSTTGWKHRTPEAAYGCGHRGFGAEPEEAEGRS
jgi:hypothetical protein